VDVHVYVDATVDGGRPIGGMERATLDFEKLDVYRCAIDFLALAVQVTKHMPRGHGDLRAERREPRIARTSTR